MVDLKESLTDILQHHDQIMDWTIIMVMLLLKASEGQTVLVERRIFAIPSQRWAGNIHVLRGKALCV